MAKHGTFYWNELATGNVRSATNFYGKLIGWTTEEMPMGDGTRYTLLKTGEAGAPPAGGVFKMPKGWCPVDGRQIWWKVEARDDLDLIGAGRHGRAVVRWDRFAARLAQKRAAMSGGERGGGG